MRMIYDNLGIIVNSFGKSKSVKKIRYHLDSWWLMVGVSSGIIRHDSTARVGQW
jgi:hypothetical protein